MELQNYIVYDGEKLYVTNLSIPFELVKVIRISYESGKRHLIVRSLDSSVNISCENRHHIFPLTITFSCNILNSSSKECLVETIDELKAEIDHLKGNIQEETIAKEKAINEVSPASWLRRCSSPFSLLYRNCKCPVFSYRLT